MLASTLLFTLLSTFALGAPASSPADVLAKRQVSSKITANNGQCLGFSGSTDIANGTPIGEVDCGSGNAIEWIFDVDQPSSIVPKGNTGFALDAGSNPGNFGKLKLWQSYPGLSQQTWWYTTDNRIAIYNGNQCLDDGNGLQTYQCTTGNTNQVFTYSGAGGGGGGGGSGCTTVTVTATVTTTVTQGQGSPSSSSGPDPNQFTSGGHYTITYKDCAPGGGGHGCEIVQPTPTAGDIVATVTLT